MDQKEPEVLGINVSENINTSETFGEAKKVFINPMNDPRIAGMAVFNTAEQITKVLELGYNLSKETGKPVVIVLHAK